MNTWLWFHIIGGGILAKLINILIGAQETVIAVLLIAVAWEVYEYLKDDVERVYGSLKRFYLDGLQDIAGAVFMAIIVVL